MDQRRIKRLSCQRVEVRQESRILIVRYHVEAGFSRVTFIELRADVFVPDGAFQGARPHRPRSLFHAFILFTSRLSTGQMGTRTASRAPRPSPRTRVRCARKTPSAASP